MFFGTFFRRIPTNMKKVQNPPVLLALDQYYNLLIKILMHTSYYTDYIRKWLIPSLL